MSHRHQFNEERFRALWSAGVGVVEIGAEFGKSKAWVSLTAQRLKLARRNARVPLGDRPRIAEAYLAGASVNQICKELRGEHPTITWENVARVLRKRGVQLRPRCGRRRVA